MKKYISSMLLACALGFSASSCTDYLDIVPEGTPTIENAFSNRINSFKFLHTCYSYLPTHDDGGNISFLAGDEHWLMPKGTGFIDQRISINGWEIGRGNQNSNDPFQNFWDGGKNGKNLWIAIRDCNIFLENIHKPRDVEDYERDRWIAEVKFLKAYYHFFLFQLYGPIPIMDTAIPIDADVADVRRYRDPVDDVVNYVANLLDEAAEGLPLSILDPGEEMGRLTKPIAKAVKAQLLLLAASPLFNGNVDFIDLQDNRGVKLFTQSEDQNKWKLAADAALEAIRVSEEAGHKLYKFIDPINISDTTRTLLSIGEAVTERWNNEIVWGSTKNSNGLQTQSMAKMTTGSHYSARSVLGPTLKVAESFYSNNGVPIEEDKSEFWSMNYAKRYTPMTIENEGANKYYFELGQQTATLHFNREPRFYASLSFDRGTWYAAGSRDDSQQTLSKYRFRRKEISGVRGSEDYSYTGYLNKKVCSYKSSLTDNGWTPYRYAFPIIRLADMYLMYAEALNEVPGSDKAQVLEYVNLVRARAGLLPVDEAWQQYSKYPNKPNTVEGRRDIIRRERLNELACEGKRFWDLRRWKEELDTEVKGWNVLGETAETFYRVSVLFERPRFTYKDYLWPIKVQSIQRNPNLVQNPGW